MHHITVTDLPATEDAQMDSGQNKPDESVAVDMTVNDSTTSAKDKVRIMIHIRMSNGMQVSKKDMDYRELHELVEKLEALC